jgi:hypothetical protein
LLDVAGSFDGDEALVRYLAANPAVKPINKEHPRPTSVPLCFFIDQHCAPSEMGYLAPAPLLSKINACALKPLEPIMRYIFENVSGYNPRLQERATTTEDFESRPAVRLVRSIQRAALACLLHSPNSESKESCQERIQVSLELAFVWIVALVGETSIAKAKNRPGMVAFLSASEPHDPTAVREVTARSVDRKKSPRLKDTEQKYAADILRGRLDEKRGDIIVGRSSRSCPPPIDEWIGARIYLDDSAEDFKDKYRFRFRDGSTESWEKLRHLSLDVDVWRDDTLFRAVCFNTDSTPEALLKLLHDRKWQTGLIFPTDSATCQTTATFIRLLVQATPSTVIRAFLAQARGFRKQLLFPAIGRDGGGSAAGLTVDIVPAYQLALRLSVVAPGALRMRPHKIIVFDVVSGPLFWHLLADLQVVLEERQAAEQRDLAASNVAAGETKKKNALSLMMASRKRPNPSNDDDAPAGKRVKLAVDRKEQKKTPEQPASAPPASPWHRAPLVDKKTKQPISTPGLPAGRQLFPQQKLMIELLRSRAGRNQFVTSAPSSGKSLSVIMHLLERDYVGGHIVWVLPNSAMMAVVRELELCNMGHLVRVVVPIKNKKTYREQFGDKVCDVPAALKYGQILVIDYDHVKRADVFLPLQQIMHRAFLIFDEVHFALDPKTKRSTACITLARQAPEGFVVFISATPTLNRTIGNTSEFLNLMVQFPVVEMRSMWPALEQLIDCDGNLGVDYEFKDVEVGWPDAATEQSYRALITEKFGGTNPHPTSANGEQAIKMCRDTSLAGLIDYTADTVLEKKRTVFGVLQDGKDVETVRSALTSAGVKNKDIFCIGHGQVINLTPADVKAGIVHPYKVVLTTMRQYTGYSVAALDEAVMTSLPCGPASRLQIIHRIVRVGQKHKLVRFTRFYAGLQKLALDAHNAAESWLGVTKELCQRGRSRPL